MNSTAFLLSRSPDENIEKMREALSCYPERYILPDGGMEIRQIKDDRFLRSDHWTLDMFTDIPQFRDAAQHGFHGPKNKIRFEFHYENLNLEAKFIAYNKVFRNHWSVPNLIYNQRQDIRMLAEYMGKRRSNIYSFLLLDAEQDTADWCEWLSERSLAVQAYTHDSVQCRKTYSHKTYLALFLQNMCKLLSSYLDDREEWAKDGWGVRKEKPFERGA